jgi:hypothetical protein
MVIALKIVTIYMRLYQNRLLFRHFEMFFGLLYKYNTTKILTLKSNFVKVEDHLVCNWVYLKIQVIDKI